MTKSKVSPTAVKGFTLLEMLVVILLVSLLSGMLMQGFIYMASVYGVVERRQSAMQTQSLFAGWLHDSISGIVNGIDHEGFERFKFHGTASGFEAISLAPLVSRLYGQPHSIQWQLEQNDELISLRYREVTIPGGAGGWHIIREWQGVEAHWLYLSDGEWVVQYPQASLRFEERPAHVLPQAIALEVIGGRRPEIVVVALVADDQEYRPPEKPGL
ncbi:MAG: prepilin-type N-terminal cleavage/methylation domain-containing protein [Spongiibacteraceae bacterium]